MMKKTAYQSVLFMLLLLSGACVVGSSKNPSAKELYERFLNLPADVSNFKGEGAEMFPVFASRAYFTYKAGHGYFEMLEKHDKFIEQSDFNERIHEVSCESGEFIRDFSYWTNQKVELREKSCFTGTFFPFVHYLVFDPITGETYHFVTGISE